MSLNVTSDTNVTMADPYVRAAGAPARFSVATSFAIAVVIASMMPAPADPLSNLGPLGLFGVDKWIHLGAYALLAFLGAFVALSRSLMILAAITVLTVLFGLGVEVLQGAIAWRTMEAADVLANTVGAVVGVTVWQITWVGLPAQFRVPADA